MQWDHPLSAVCDAHSIYPQLTSMSGGCLLHPQPEDAPCHGDRDPLNMYCAVVCFAVRIWQPWDV